MTREEAQARYDFLAELAADMLLQFAIDRRRARADLSAAATPAGVMDEPNVLLYPSATSSSDSPKNSLCSNMN